jgi:hypothetical protein
MLLDLPHGRIDAVGSESSSMDPQPKMTKQGVRDLNHLNPKKQRPPIEVKSASPDEALVVPPPAAVPESAAESPIAK